MKPVLELSAVSKRFGRDPVLNQVWMQVRACEIVGLMGRNGAGKTTTLRIAAGLVRADGGSVRLDGAAAAPGSVRYFGGERTLPGHVSIRAWARLFELTVSDRRSIGRLSRGNRQLLGLRTMLDHAGANLLLLDEPWEGLDPEGSRWLTNGLRAARDRGAAALVSSHRLADLADVCDRCLFLHDGRITPVASGDEVSVRSLLAEFERRP